MMEPIKRIPLVAQVEERIETMIRDEGFRPGTKLPAEVTLCRELNVSRGTIREALKSLQARGIVELQSGKGAFVAEPKAAENPEAIHWLIENEEDLRYFLELREAVEPLAAHLATLRGDERMRETLQALHQQFVDAAVGHDYMKLAELDERFHRTISDACGNPLIREIMDTLNPGVFSFRQNTFKVNQNVYDTIGPHGKILKAILAGDPAKAEREMKRHVHKIAENLTLNISTANPPKST